MCILINLVLDDAYIFMSSTEHDSYILISYTKYDSYILLSYTESENHCPIAQPPAHLLSTSKTQLTPDLFPPESTEAGSLVTYTIVITSPNPFSYWQSLDAYK